MEKIPSSFIGYNKHYIDNLLNEKDTLLSTQKQDICYLRSEVERLEKKIKKIEEKN